MSIATKFISALFLLLTIAVASVRADGEAPASFKKDCLPYIKNNHDVMAVLAAFDYKDDGFCLYVSPTAPSEIATARQFPFVFLARLKGDKGPYSYLLVIDCLERISSLQSQIVAQNLQDSLHLNPRVIVESYKQYGVAIWPLPTKASP